MNDQRVWIVLKRDPYAEPAAPDVAIQGVYGDPIDAQCHADTLEANERADATYFIESWRVAEWEGGQ